MKEVDISCQLTTKALKERRKTVLKQLKSRLLNKRTLKNGFEFQFPGTDIVLRELTEFILSERQCCPFFTFQLEVEKDGIRMELTGPPGTRAFIESTLGL